jgi:translation initiation factor 3 subunit B
MNHFAFDSKHTFKINQFTDIESFADMDETYYEPEVEDYKPRVCAPIRTVFAQLT